MLLLHGFPENASMWSGVEPALHAAGLRTIAPDQRGYSPGARPDGVEAYSMHRVVADALGLLDAYGLAGRTCSATTGARRSAGTSPAGTRTGSPR